MVSRPKLLGLLIYPNVKRADFIRSPLTFQAPYTIMFAMKTLYKITFMHHNEPVQVYAKSVHSSDILGLVDVNDIVFIDSSDIIINPEDDKVKKIFKNVVRTMIPLNHVMRIDEVTLSKGTAIVQLYTTTNETDH